MVRVALLFVSLIAIVRAPAFADVEVGDVIGKGNAEKVKELVSPGLYWCVQHGLPMRIVAPRTLVWPPAYKEATEKYHAQVRLTPDGRRLEGYVAGAPFPLIDTKDPLVATKLVWNYNFGDAKGTNEAQFTIAELIESGH